MPFTAWEVPMRFKESFFFVDMPAVAMVVRENKRTIRIIILFKLDIPVLAKICLLHFISSIINIS